MSGVQTKRAVLFRLFAVLAGVCLGMAYFQPLWWVSLKAVQYQAPNYPEGVKIMFYMDGVKNGCPFIDSDEIYEDEEVDCVQEMNVINHFIGMHPIEHAGTVEQEALGSTYDIIYSVLNTLNSIVGAPELEEGLQLEVAAAPHITILALLFLFLFLVYSGPLWWMLAVPTFVVAPSFVAFYSFWLWWFGHNLQTWGAFSVKPFMPTVFGDSKVAQFGTHSYPTTGFALLCAASVLVLLAVLVRRKHIKEMKS
jgi:hypothetical protein